MATLTLSTPFVTGNTIIAADVNTSFSAIKTFIDTEVIQRDGTTDFTSLISGPSTDPTSANHLARKAYVDAQVSALAVAGQVAVANGTDSTSFPLFVGAATGDLAVKSNAALKYNASTGDLQSTKFTGALVGNADTAGSLTDAWADSSLTLWQNTTQITYGSDRTRILNLGKVTLVLFDLLTTGAGDAYNLQMKGLPTAASATQSISGAMMLSYGSLNLHLHAAGNTTTSCIWREEGVSADIYNSTVASGVYMRGYLIIENA